MKNMYQGFFGHETKSIPINKKNPLRWQKLEKDEWTHHHYKNGGKNEIGDKFINKDHKLKPQSFSTILHHKYILHNFFFVHFFFI